MDPEERLRNLLVALGDKPKEIASKLAQEGCFGVAEPEACPLAIYVTGSLELQRRAYVGADGDVFVHLPDGTELAIDCLLMHPQLCQFIHNFDHGEYPFLEAI